MTELEYAPFELMAVAGARELKDGEIVCVGLGLPIVSSFLAKRTHAPNITIPVEKSKIAFMDHDSRDIRAPYITCFWFIFSLQATHGRGI